MKPADTISSLRRVWVWIWSGILTLLVCVFPIEYQVTRLALILGTVSFWTGGLLLSWKRTRIRVGLLLLGMIPFAALWLPGRPVNPESLASDYSRGLRLFGGVRYVWGGESLLGIDCSGLVRKGLVWGQLYRGIRTFNGRPIRDALALWWHDASALELRNGFEGRTAEVFRADSVARADFSKLRTGDLAVTADGVHVMAYLGGGAWIEADPAEHKVIEVTPPTDNPWFGVPVVFVRWNCLRPGGS